VLKGLVEPDGITTITHSKDNPNPKVLNFNAEREGQTIAEIIYWERPQGGRVFHTGYIATAWAMYYDESLSNLVWNVFHLLQGLPRKGS